MKGNPWMLGIAILFTVIFALMWLVNLSAAHNQATDIHERIRARRSLTSLPAFFAAGTVAIIWLRYAGVWTW